MTKIQHHTDFNDLNFICDRQLDTSATSSVTGRSFNSRSGACGVARRRLGCVRRVDGENDEEESGEVRFLCAVRCAGLAVDRAARWQPFSL